MSDSQAFILVDSKIYSFVCLKAITTIYAKNLPITQKIFAALLFFLIYLILILKRTFL